jgi:DHA1 family tetracycline resistance protein-like MFS transporter
LDSPRPGNRAAMPFIMAVTLIDMITIGLIIPVLPALVGELTGAQDQQAYWYGVVTFAFGLANFLASPVLGALSDAHGRRPILLLGFSGLALSFLATGLAGTIWVLVAVRIISGATMANMAVSNAYVADITPPEDRAKRFGMLGAMFGIGFILGPVIGGLLGAIDVRAPFFAAGGLALINLMYGLFVLPESLPPERRKPFAWSGTSPVKSLQGLAALHGVGRLVTVIACNGLAQFTLYTCWVLYTTFKFGWGPLENGWALAAVGIVNAIVQGFLMGRMVKHFGTRRLALLGLGSSFLAYLAYALASDGWMLFAIIFVNIFGATVAASIQSIISGAADAQNQGRALGAVGGLNSLMSVAAPVIGAPLLAMVSHLPAGDWRIGMPMFFCAALQGAALLLAVSHFRGAK